MMLSCEEAVRRIASADGGRQGRLGLWLHLRMCEKCRRYKSQIDQIGEAARRLWTASADEEPVARLRDRILGEDSGAGRS